MQHITFNKQAREKLKNGVDLVANTVRITMGPKGKVVVIDGRETDFTLDGVTVAQSIQELSDPVENMGAQLIKTVAKKTNDAVGDATTTATVLTQALVEQGIMGIDSKLDPILIKRGLEDGSRIVISALRELSIPVKDRKQMAEVGTISSRDPEIGNIISEIYSKIGPEGLIDVEEAKTIGTSFEIVQGTQIDSGWVSHYFITDAERMIATLDNPYVLVTTKTISDGDELIPLLEQIFETEKKSLVIIADNIEGEALILLLKNKVMGKLKLLAVKAPGFGDNKVQFLEDIAVLTNTVVLTDNITSIKDITLQDLGRCDRVVSTKLWTRFIGGKGKKTKIAEHIQVLRRTMATIKAVEHKALWSTRCARLAGGVAVIRTGSISDAESKEKRYRIEDAVNATRAAIEEGIVIGGGMALVQASDRLTAMIAAVTDHSYRFGLQALQFACREPARQIILNAGRNPDVILEAISKKYIMGFDSNGGDYVDMIKKGIIDPLKAPRIALENAIAAASMLLITGATVSNIKTNGDETK